MSRLRDYIAALVPARARTVAGHVAGTAAYRLTARTVRDTFADRAPGMAAELAFFTLLSLPALLLVFLGSLGFIAEALGPSGQAELHRLVFDVPQTVLNPGTYHSYAELATKVLREGRSGVLSFGVVLSLWSGSRAAARMIDTVAIAYDLTDPRSLWRRRALAVGLTLTGLVTVIAVLPALVLVRVVVQPGTGALLTATGFLTLLGLTWLYHVAAPWQTPWRRDLPGAVLAISLWLLSALALRVYIRYTVQNDEVFTRLAAPLAVMLWLYVTAFAVLLGAELNAEIEKMWPHRNFPWHLRRSPQSRSASPEDPGGVS